MTRERGGERGSALAALLLVLSLAGGCGYGFAAGGKLTGGVERVQVLPFENRSTQPELGAVLAAALREELAARGALATTRDGAAVLSGEVSAMAPAPAAPGGVSWRFAIDVRARLLQGERVVAERKLRREGGYPAGLDALETEGRRAQAARRLATEIARELVSTLME